MMEARRGRPRASYNQTGEFDLSLIDEFRSRPALYDRTSMLFKDKEHTHQQWTAISHKLGYDIPILRDRMVQLRNRFNIEKRRLEQLREEQNDPSLGSPWPLYDSLDFLGDHIRSRRTYRKLYPNPMVSAELNGDDDDEYDCSIQEPQIKMEHASEASDDGSDEPRRSGTGQQHQQQHPHPLKTFLNGGTPPTQSKASAVGATNARSLTAAATMNNSNVNQTTVDQQAKLGGIVRPLSKRLAERVQLGKQHFLNGRIRVVPETQRNAANLSSPISAEDSSDATTISAAQKRKREGYHHLQLQPTVRVAGGSGLNGSYNMAYASGIRRGRGRPPQQQIKICADERIAAGASQTLAADSQLTASSAAGASGGAADEDNSFQSPLKRQHIDYDNARVYKYQAFGDFVVSSLLELPQKVSLGLIQRFTTELIQQLDEHTKDEKLPKQQSSSVPSSSASSSVGGIIANETVAPGQQTKSID